jgi:hypothetical protein
LFHGSKKEDAPKDKDRGKLVMGLLQKADKDNEGNLTFNINGFKVCLPTFLRFLGVSKSVDLRDAPRQWTRLTKAHIEGEEDQTTLLTDEDLKADAEETHRVKEGHCTSFIQEYMSFFSDCIPIAASVDETGNPVTTVVVPFRNYVDFYGEYVFFSQTYGISEADMAGETTFRTAMKQMENQKLVRFMGGKSGIPTCAVCNNMKQIKKSACCKRDEITRKVLIKLARLHLLQQKAERQHAENFIMESKKLEDGHPTVGYIDIDPMSVWTGNTPKVKIGGRSMKFDKVVENRNVGIRLVCGPIDEYISVCTNNLIPGGANVLVEVTRYSIEYLGRRLAEFGMLIPRKLGIQFDNSGENKVSNIII